MSGYVVDASVVVKWLVSENLSDEASGLLKSKATLVAPALVFAEAANAMWAMCKRGDIDVDDMTDAVHALQAAPIDTPVSMKRLIPAAARLAVDLDHPVYDCLYLALAIQTQYPVVTADTRFHDKVRGHPYLAESVLHVADAASPDGRSLN